MFSRRNFLTHTAGAVVAAVAGRRVWAEPATLTPTPITVYKSATCACCTQWVDHVKANGFAPTVHDEEGMEEIKDELGVPKSVRSCHTAIMGKYLVEGHVPASDLHRLLKERPALAGLAVPGMPSGTPGMLAPGATPEPFEVVGFNAGGQTSLFARH